MIVVHEVRITVVDALVIGHVREWGVHAHTFGDDLIQRPAGAHQVVIDLTGANLVAHQDAVLEFFV